MARLVSDFPSLYAVRRCRHVTVAVWGDNLLECSLMKGPAVINFVGAFLCIIINVIAGCLQCFLV